MASRLVDQVWAVRDSAFGAYLSDMAAGRLRPVTGEKAAAWRREGTVAVFNVEGVMVPTAEWFGETGTQDLAKALNAAAANEDIDAGVLVINSPGGMAQGMTELMDAVQAFTAAKPLMAHVSGACCSAAYWLASGATAIYAGTRDDIGSIGVRSLIYDFSAYFEQMGIEAVSTATGPLKDLGVMGAPVTDGQRAYLQERVDYLFADFKQAVIEGRGFTDEQFEKVSDGRVWFTSQAVELGLLDGLQKLNDTVAAALAAASLTPQRSVAMAEQATQETAGPVPATLEQLEDLMPKASSDFILGQLKAKATETQALKAYSEHLAAENERIAAERDDAAKKAEKAAAEPAAGVSRGVKVPTGFTASEGETEDSDPQASWVEAIQKEQSASGCSRFQAAQRVRKRYPNLAKAAYAAARA